MDPHVVRKPLGDDPTTATLYYGQDVRDSLRQLPDESVHCVVTSPPYWGLRDYGTDPSVWEDGWTGELGQEPSPEQFVKHLVEVFRELHRVLRSDGTLWLNLGDSYFNGKHDVLKSKDLVGVPWRVALALQDAGWWLRNDIIWAKKNNMPSPVQDRLTCSHEHIFLLTKSAKYFFDLDAIRIPHTYGEYDDEGNFAPAQEWLSETGDRDDRKMDQTEGQLGTMAGSPRRFGRGLFHKLGKNPSDVWSMATQPFPGAHFAVFPMELPTRCIQAGTSEHGVCASCGDPWFRAKEYGEREESTGVSNGIAPELESRGTRAKDPSGKGGNVLAARPVIGMRWEPSCKCEGATLTRAVVLDPFSGSGTTGMAAMALDRDYIGTDKNLKYLGMASARVLGEKPTDQAPVAHEPGSILDMFGD